MRPKSITLYRIRVPFRKPFEHASAIRTFTENIVIHSIAKDGVEGWGETIAREYVTGDTTDEVAARCVQVPRSMWDRAFITAHDVLRFCEEAGLASANVARCAIEMALLDGLARRARQPIHEFLAASWPDLAQIRNRPPFRYSGPLGVGTPVKTFVTAVKLRMFGVAAVKMKLTNDAAHDRRCLKIARLVLGSAVDLRVDANESWSLAHALAMAPILRQLGVTAVEQPFSKTNSADAAQFWRREEIPIIFDESLCSEADAEALAGNRIPQIFAVKLAKLGGFVSTLRILAIAARQGIPIQISCQVGESAILSAAGRQLAMLCPNLRYLEGSYDRFLLSDNVIAGDITVGKGGLAPGLTGAGLGISVDLAAIERLSTQKVVLFNTAD